MWGRPGGAQSLVLSIAGMEPGCDRELSSQVDAESRLGFCQSRSDATSTIEMFEMWQSGSGSEPY